MGVVPFDLRVGRATKSSLMAMEATGSSGGDDEGLTDAGIVSSKCR